ncbi:MAG: GTPase HflX [Lachnospiraceae bacterium]|nr:GTPase HflX [Lachnospiraceae bacterium]
MIEDNKERALLVGVDTGEEVDFERSMEELKSLAEACNMRVVGLITQKMATINKALYVGTGKVAEIREFIVECEAQVVIFDNALSPSQMRNLQDALDMPILDRTTLILDIFAIRAQTREAKLQVETARLQYLLPRLVGMHEALSRQGGASGSMSNKGTGEKKLELDRRKIEHRISELRKELDAVEVDRQTQRKKRMNSRVPQVALVGYTNAGKSTVMNRMVEAYNGNEEKKVLEKDMLFATLETSVRTIETGDNKPFFLVDTVGFIHKLPHGLVKAFHSTLEEVRYADLLVQVVDFSDPQHRLQMDVTRETLKELGAGNIPMLIVYNKAESNMEELPHIHDKQIYMSAVNSVGIEELIDLIKQQVYANNKDVSFLFPYDKGSVVSYFMENATVLEQEYLENGVRLVVNCHKADVDKYSEYLFLTDT